MFGFPGLGGMGGFGGSNGGEGRTREAWESENPEIWDPESDEMPALGADGIIGQNASWRDSGNRSVDSGRREGYVPRGRFDGTPGRAGGMAGRHAKAGAQEMFPVTGVKRADDGWGHESGWQSQEWTDEGRDPWAPEGTNVPPTCRERWGDDA